MNCSLCLGGGNSKSPIRMRAVFCRGVCVCVCDCALVIRHLEILCLTAGEEEREGWMSFIQSVIPETSKEEMLAISLGPDNSLTLFTHTEIHDGVHLTCLSSHPPSAPSGTW